MTKTLIIDIGNSRIKWARLKSDGYELLGEAPHEGVLDPIFCGDFPCREKVDMIMIASVLGLENDALIKHSVTIQTGVTPEFVYSQSCQFGITNAYSEPQQLGVDRWLALIGARLLSDRALCVIDVGTAITVDALDLEGTHLGGLITPGFRLLNDALTGRAEQLKGISPGQIVELADNTEDAISSGIHWSVVGFLNESLSRLETKLGEFDVLLTGGDSQKVAPYLGVEYRHVDGLVLAGLAEVARERK